MSITPAELDEFKRILKEMRKEIKQLWLEKQILRSLIIDSGWMPAANLDSGLEEPKKDPLNVRDAEEQFAGSEQTLAEIGLPEWLEALDKMYPRTD